MKSSGLRRPRLTNSSSDEHKSDKPLSLAEFTKASHQNLLLSRQADKQRQDDITINIQDAKQDENDDVSMAQCVTLLDPHLTIFRDTCIASQHKSKEGVDNDDTTGCKQDEVPSQLLRLARFFTWRWLPIKKALLRPPPLLELQDEQEVEISLTYRLRLAKACWKKGLLAAAEYESLSASFQSRKRGGDRQTGSDEKRYKSDSLLERVRLALMRLPTEVVTNERAMLAWRHVNAVLLEFCKSTNNSDDTGESIEQVTDWLLTSWTGLVLSQGMDTSSLSALNHSSSKSAIPAIETQFANLLSNRESSSDTLVLAQAAAKRIDELLTPHNLTSLNGIHIYSLAKLLARFHSAQLAEKHIAKSIAKCSEKGGMTFMEQWSRLMAVFVCLIGLVSYGESSSREQSAVLITGLEQKLLSKMSETVGKNVNANSGQTASSSNRIDHNADRARTQSFLKVIMNGAAHLCLTSRT
ncbi:hypothetical protein ACHAXN_004249 [Cyclotella atomus]